jgi:integrase
MSELQISIRQRKDRPGKWVADVRRGSERHQTAFDSYEEARDFAREVERSERRGELKAAQAVAATLEGVCNLFIESKTAEGLAEATIATYRGLLTQQVLPFLGPSRNAHDLTEMDVERFRDQRMKDGVSPWTVRAELDRLRALLAHAQRLGLVRRNVAAAVKPPKVREEPKDWLRSHEIGPFLDACSGDFYAIALFTMFTGLRRREVVFLQRADVDLANGVVQIRAKPHLGFRPKSGRERSVPIDPTLRPFVEKRLRECVGPSDEAWVFPTREGTRYSGKTRWFAVSTHETAKKAGINRPLTFHDLRRTFGAMLIESGVHIYTVSKLLGHSDVRITEKVYAPISGKFLASEASRLGRHLGQMLTREVPPLPPLEVAESVRNQVATATTMSATK